MRLDELALRRTLGTIPATGVRDESLVAEVGVGASPEHIDDSSAWTDRIGVGAQGSSTQTLVALPATVVHFVPEIVVCASPEHIDNSSAWTDRIWVRAQGPSMQRLGSIPAGARSEPLVPEIVVGTSPEHVHHP